jgi:hypothetical protein
MGEAGNTQGASSNVAKVKSRNEGEQKKFKSDPDLAVVVNVVSIPVNDQRFGMSRVPRHRSLRLHFH